MAKSETNVRIQHQKLAKVWNLVSSETDFLPDQKVAYYGEMYQVKRFTKSLETGNSLTFEKTFEWNHNQFGSRKKSPKINFTHFNIERDYRS